MNETAVIMAGGKGTRISSVRSDLPKPMIEVCGRPVLEHQLDCLKANGITDVVLVIGHLGDCIRRHFNDGARFGVRIRYIDEKSPLGTAGALFFLKDLIDDFFLINGDIIFDVDLNRMMAYHRKNRAEITLLAHPNNHPHDSTLLGLDADGRVTRWGGQRSDTMRNCVNAGIHVVSPAVLEDMSEPVPRSLDKEVIACRLGKGGVYAYRSPEYVHDMGTPERYRSVCRDVERGLAAAKNRSLPQKAIFLDRDGTINSPCGFLSSPDQMALEAGAAQAIRAVNHSGYLAIVVTNQPVIARGGCTMDQLDAIHGRMDQLLGKEGAYLDDILFCPHHPDRGFPGERPEYKIDCPCRKPRPGLLLQAAQCHGIDLSASWMIGDTERDVQAGLNAGCKTVRIACCGTETQADFVCEHLWDAVQMIIPESCGF